MSKRPDAFARLSSMLEGQRETSDTTPALPAEIVPGTDAELSTSEQQALTHYEQVIERGLKTFFEVGAALLHVRDLRLYRTEYATFEAYCDEKWGMGKAYAHRLIGAATVRDNLSPIGDVLPANEAQARPLTLLEPEQQREAWQRAVQRAQELGKRITAALVEAVVNELQPRPAAPLPLTDTEGEIPAPAAAPEAQIIDLQPEPAPPAPALDDQADDVAELRREVQRLQGENAVAHRWNGAIQGLLKENQHLRQQADQRAAYNSRSPLAIYVNELLGILDEIEDVLGIERGKHTARTKQ
jgi:hypothetical protein